MIARFFRRPPQRLFHIALVPAGALLIYSTSFPGFAFWLMLLGALLAALGAFIWVARLIGYLLAHRRDRVRSPVSRWFLVAPAAGALVVLAMFSGLPLRARWAIAKPDFERALAAAPPANHGRWQAFDPPDRVGTYLIRRGARVGDAVIFYEQEGAFMNDAGFAYLPSGPRAVARAFEGPHFRALGGDWYAWTSSW